TKYKKSKAEASAVQSTLQKEITSLRDAHRTLQLKLRDIEVANDDYERQARHTTSSLEDMESKYNVAIERGVLLEEEVKTGEQEREKLRIENQRLRDELADLKVETHIIQEKLKKAEVAQAEAAAKSSTKSRPASRKSLPAPKTKPEPSSVTRTRARAPSGPPSPSSLNTTKTRSSGSLSSNSSNPPPVPPLPEKPPVQRKPSMQPTMARLPRKSGADPSFPKSGARGVTRHSRVASQNTRAAQAARAQSARNAAHANANGIRRISELPQQLQRDESPPAEAETASNDPAIGHAGSLYQIRGLIGKMQKLEDRIQSARSRLPAPTESSPRASSRTQSKDLPHGFVSLGGSLTMRNTLSRA
ncbi:NADH:ubiquinone oxidoreductase, partial [Ascosphaera atra]